MADEFCGADINVHYLIQRYMYMAENDLMRKFSNNGSSYLKQVTSNKSLMSGIKETAYSMIDISSCFRPVVAYWS